MTLTWWRSSKNRRAKGQTRGRSRMAGDRLPLRLYVEAMEDRLTPALHIWSGAAGDQMWSDPGNWAVGGVPTEDNSTIEFPIGLAGAAKVSTNDLQSALGITPNVGEILIDDSGYTICGQAINMTASSDASGTVSDNHFHASVDMATAFFHGVAGKSTIALDITLIHFAPGGSSPFFHCFTAEPGDTLTFQDAIHGALTETLELNSKLLSYSSVATGTI
jgi:hypothetical protein